MSLSEQDREALVDAVLRLKNPALFAGDWRAQKNGERTTKWIAEMVMEAETFVDLIDRRETEVRNRIAAEIEALESETWAHADARTKLTEAAAIARGGQR